MYLILKIERTLQKERKFNFIYLVQEKKKMTRQSRDYNIN